MTRSRSTWPVLLLGFSLVGVGCEGGPSGTNTGSSGAKGAPSPEPGAAGADPSGATAGAPAALPAPRKVGGNEPGAAYRQEDTTENLRGLLDLVVKTSEAGDMKKAGAMVRALLPDENAMKKAFKDDVKPEILAKMNGNMVQVPTDDAELAGAIRRGEPNRTEIRIHGATAEEIATGSTPASGEFPGGAQSVAGDLRPGLRFYEVEFVEPGADMGMKYHLLFWDGSAWRMLGPAWRTIDGD